MLSALGLLPLACGGAFSSKDDDGSGDAGKASGGTSSGGTKSNGGTKASAGSATGGSKPGSGGKASGGSGNVAGNTSSSGNDFPCEDPVVVGAGYERCKNGTLHRPTIQKCESSLPRPAPIDPAVGSSCFSDTDCTAMPNGYCRSNSGGQIPGNHCFYGCQTDAECGDGQICVCGEPVGNCAVATCTSDAECGDGLRCQSYDWSNGCGLTGFACQTFDDKCGGDGDCEPTQQCVTSLEGATDKTGAFSCRPPGCVVGRPFLVEGQARVATVSRRSDWGTRCELDLSHASTEQRELAGQAWCRIGQMEHASVAAFARFALQLLSLGAPPELIEATTAAMADETRHAQLAFGLASALHGQSVGPAALDVEHSLLETSLLDVTRLVILEGCIGETCAALEAREAAMNAAQPELAQLLHGVADDETRHAELAWRFVAYALERAPEPVAALLRAEVNRALADLEPAAGDVSAAELALTAYGLVPKRLRSELQASALREVVAPCAAALLQRGCGAVAENQVLSA